MSELPWMPVYIGTETALTGHLSPEEFGCYERLRRHWWQHGSLPEDATRLMRITGVDPDKWEDVAKAIGPLMSDSIRRLDDERSGAAAKREKKVAAGRKGAEAKWRPHGRTISDANGTTMADASDEMANASFCQWPSPSASPSESSLREEKEEGLEPARERQPNVLLMSMDEVKEHLRETGALADDEFGGL
ncbi:DUF1376 domain-containing protein [Mesorhizobium sp. M2A.F.Ca.ET.037.01.1.1]|nr:MULTISPECIES: DUF1376 domain-containing protein [unclassified Mesorhizobium]RUX09922.1 DUF1376 domain-containing protein [Mesorhizobium sp. M2A.F.Ca.ET.037.01.1.1]RWA93634.1 MAG: DUF1376 domain-containing protein [Mesorhizobium sp.]RWX60637.1 DUF1376 domain-containing protein [Mesorhizobium sp. M2A.F.Ca.ET.039.01.1.1]TIV18851.1 MAG: DUF1376 domain-containing protein [Mesorhizobium sp.]TIV29160.1 MAG: DUF1376 domain-containing protein [Mesorhizobium sp.]